MSQERIVTQPLGDPVGSIYEIDGKCYVKTSDASGTMNNLVTKSDGECATTADTDLTECETGSGKRTAAVSTGGGYICHGNARSIDDINYLVSWHESRLRYRNQITWPLSYSAPGGDPGIDTSVIPYQAPAPNVNLPEKFSMFICKILHAGWVRFTPASVIRGFDEFLYWGRGRWPHHRPAGFYRFRVQHAETDEWHDVAYFNNTVFRNWVGYFTGRDPGKINVQAYSMHGSYHPYVHLTPNNDDERFQVPAKFHNMPIKSVEVYYKTGTMFVWSMEIYALQMYKNGEKINLMDNSIVLRSKAAKGSGALV